MANLTTAEFAVRFAIASLAVWRLTHLLALEDGPWDAVARLRAKLGDSFWGRLMDCFYCLSVWIAIPAAFFVTRHPIPWVVSWLALSGGACLIQQLFEKPVVIERDPQPPTGEDNVLR